MYLWCSASSIVVVTTTRGKSTLPTSSPLQLRSKTFRRHQTVPESRVLNRTLRQQPFLITKAMDVRQYHIAIAIHLYFSKHASVFYMKAYFDFIRWTMHFPGKPIYLGHARIVQICYGTGINIKDQHSSGMIIKNDTPWGRPCETSSGDQCISLMVLLSLERIRSKSYISVENGFIYKTTPHVFLFC